VLFAEISPVRRKKHTETETLRAHVRRCGHLENFEGPKVQPQEMEMEAEKTPPKGFGFCSSVASGAAVSEGGL